MSGNAEIIFTGDELLRGDIVNTNQAFLGEKLLDIGILTTRAVCVPDSLEAIAGEIKDSLRRRPRVTILSGGLGPTDDDLTREAVAEALEAPLEHHEELLRQIEELFASRGFPMSDTNRKQAMLPRGATAIPFAGTAPGFHLQRGETTVVALPGVPWELEQMWNNTVQPLLEPPQPEASGALPSSARPRDESHQVRRIRTFGLGESSLAELLSDFDWQDPRAAIGTRANLEGVSLILRGLDTIEGRDYMDRVQATVLSLLGKHVYSTAGESLPEVAGRLLASAGLTISTAESCTGGLLGKLLTDVSGSSGYFMGGVISYDNRVKAEMLGVSTTLLETYGAVSPRVAAAMAEGAARILNTNCALSTTGVAGPSGGTVEKPVGMVFLGSVVNGATEVEELRLFGTRDQIRTRAAYAALNHLRRRLTR